MCAPAHVWVCNVARCGHLGARLPLDGCAVAPVEHSEVDDDVGNDEHEEHKRAHGQEHEHELIALRLRQRHLQREQAHRVAREARREDAEGEEEGRRPDEGLREGEELGGAAVCPRAAQQVAPVRAMIERARILTREVRMLLVVPSVDHVPPHEHERILEDESKDDGKCTREECVDQMDKVGRHTACAAIDAATRHAAASSLVQLRGAP